MTTKTISKFCLFAALGLASVVLTSAKDDELKSGESDPKTTDAGVVINGVTWATRNVDAFGTFAETPESAGMFYQWNRAKAWSATEPAANIAIADWDTTMSTSPTWEKANDPSPKGWRVPRKDEQDKLFDTEKVTNEWTTQNGVTGCKFTDKATGNSLFFPAAGFRRASTGVLYGVGTYGGYRSGTPYGGGRKVGVHAYFVYFTELTAYVNYDSRRLGFSVRPVLAE